MSEGIVEAARRLAQFLAELGKPAAVIGGIAINARVRIRATKDIDALVLLDTEDIARLIVLAHKHGYDPGSTPDADLLEMGMLRMWGPPGKPGGTIADLIVADAAFLRDAVARATPVSFSGVELPIATAEDLLVMKLDANRAIDLDDAIAIKDALGDRLDLVWVRRQADAAGPAVRRRLDLMFPA